jgi:hypothetical protein
MIHRTVLVVPSKVRRYFLWLPCRRCQCAGGYLETMPNQMRPRGGDLVPSPSHQRGGICFFSNHAGFPRLLLLKRPCWTLGREKRRPLADEENLEALHSSIRSRHDTVCVLALLQPEGHPEAFEFSFIQRLRMVLLG